MQFSNRERVGRGLDAVRAGLIPYVRTELTRLYGSDWLLKARASLRTLPHGNGAELNLDVTALITIILDRVHAGFANLRRAPHNSYLGEIRAARNKYAHQEEFSGPDTDRALDTMRLVLGVVAPVEAATIERLRNRDFAAVTVPVSSRPPKSQQITSHPVTSRTAVPATIGILAPDVAGYERGVKLFRFLAEAANRGLALGVGYAAFIECLHNRPFESVMGRPYAMSDTGPVIEIAHAITRKADRITVTRAGTSIKTGMDTFIWPLKKPHERSDSAWKYGLPYTKTEWKKVFPDHLRKLMSNDELAFRIKS